MPFTAAHPIAVAPLWYLSRQRLPLPALVTGSLSPDFPYLANLTPVHAAGHSLAGLFTHCLAPSLLVLALWYLWLARPVHEVLGMRYAAVPRLTSAWLALTVLAVLLGAATHALWDATSHAHGYFVEHADWLRLSMLGLPMFKWNQYLGGVLGLAALACWFACAAPRSAHRPGVRREQRIAIAILLVSMVLFVALAHLIHGFASWPLFMVRSAIGVLVGVFAGTLVYASVARTAFVRSPK